MIPYDYLIVKSKTLPNPPVPLAVNIRQYPQMQKIMQKYTKVSDFHSINY